MAYKFVGLIGRAVILSVEKHECSMIIKSLSQGRFDFPFLEWLTTNPLSFSLLIPISRHVKGLSFSSRWRLSPARMADQE